MKLTKAARSKIPAGKFAGPGRSFPVEDKNHAKAALIDVGRAKGLSASAKDIIRQKARRELLLGK